VAGSNFGCDSLASVNDSGHNHGDKSGTESSNQQHTPYGMQGPLLGDGERSGPPGLHRGGGSMAATAHSDHGPHNLHPGQNGGVRSLRSVQGG